MYTLFLSIFYFLLCIQLIFWLAVAVKLLPRLRKNQDAPQPLPTDPISLIICAKNERKNIEQFISSWCGQSYPLYEVLLVDDASTDGTAELLQDLQKVYPNLKVLTLSDEEKEGKGKKYALQKGLEAATYDWVALTDADCKPLSALWLTTLSKTINDKKSIGLGYGGYINLPGFLNNVIQFETVYTFIQYATFAIMGVPYMGVGRNLFYDRRLILESGGLKPYYDVASGDDDLLINAVITKDNFSLITAPSSYTISHPCTTWRSYIRQKNRHYSVGAKYKTLHLVLLGLLSASLFGIHIAFLSSLLVSFEWNMVCLYIFRLLFITFIQYTVSKKVGSGINFMFLIILDLFWWVYLLAFSFSLTKGDVKNW